MSAANEWEQAFNTLDKRVFSVDAIGGYDFQSHLENHTKKSSTILDFGCGKGDLVKKFREDGYTSIYGTDPSGGLLAQSSLGSEILKRMDNGMIPFPDNTFDFVYCSGVLHHIEWGLYPGVLTELKRVLKPGGIFLWSEPRNSLWRKLGHMAVLSPFRKFNRNVDALAACLRAEWPTYYPWLVREEKEFVPLCQQLGFIFQGSETKMFTVIGLVKNEK